VKAVAAWLLVAATAAACAAARPASIGPLKVDLPVSDGRAAAERSPRGREAPPPAGSAPQAPFPAVARAALPTGLSLAVVSAPALPVVEVRLVVRAGSAGAPAPGVADLTARMLKDGGSARMTGAEVLRRVEALGADLSVTSDADATVFGLALTQDKLESGLATLSELVRAPRFDEGELRKVKTRWIDEVKDAARSDAAWAATWLAFRELYPDGHPYALRAALPSQIARIDGAQLRDFHRRFFVPRRSTLVLAGDVAEAPARELAARHFGAWTAATDPAPAELKPAAGPRRPRVLLAHRPRSVQSDVYLALLAPARTDAAGRWAHVRVANQVLGGGAASRLFADVREARSLAYRTNAQILELARGEQPVLVYAGTESSKTAQAVTGLLENVARMTTAPPTFDEVDTARRYLGDIFAVRMETVGAIADMIVTQETFGLPDGYWDAYRAELRGTTTRDAADAAAKLYGRPPVVVVAGDADVIGRELTRFGDVVVVDPENEFAQLRVLTSGSAAGATERSGD
jgi:predicted Zn-dependent peptidase